MLSTGDNACTSAGCRGKAQYLVSWKASPEGLPFCQRCAAKLAEHGDRVRPLADGVTPDPRMPSALRQGQA